MDEVFDAMIKRRSIRKYRPDMPSDDTIGRIVEAGLYAASGKNTQDTKLIVVRDRKTRDEIMEHNREFGGWPEGHDPFYGAPVFIAVISRKGPNCRYDGALVMGNLMLASYAAGLGSCWINRCYQEFEGEYGKNLLKSLGIEGEWEGIGFCALGYPDTELPEPSVRKEGRVYGV